MPARPNATRTFHAMHGQPGGSTGIDDAFASAWDPGIGAEIMGRGKFGPHHGPWPDQEWNRWWGGNPPFHTPVFVLTHHLRPPAQMNGGTTFQFLDASPARALAQARQAAAGRDIRIGGGPCAVREFLAAGLIGRGRLGRRAWSSGGDQAGVRTAMITPRAVPALLHQGALVGADDLVVLVEEDVVRPVDADVVDLVLAIAQLHNTVDDGPRVGGQRSFRRLIGCRSADDRPRPLAVARRDLTDLL
jgi:hypothetical protein